MAAEAERLIARRASRPSAIACSCARRSEGRWSARRWRSAPCPFRLVGPAAYFQRAEVRDVLAWMRLLADPSDSGAAVRALSRPPVDLHSVDIARLTQLARRRKLDMAARRGRGARGPAAVPRRAATARQAFLRLYRPAAARVRGHAGPTRSCSG